MSGFAATTAVATLSARRFSRSPLLLAATAGLAVLWGSFPPLDAVDPVGAVRQGLSTVVSALVAVCGTIAVAAVVRQGAAWRDSAAGRLRGPRLATAGELAGLSLAVLATAGAGALCGFAWIRLTGADPGRPVEEPFLRQVLWSNGSPHRIGPGETFVVKVRPDDAAFGAVILDLGGRLVHAPVAATTRSADADDASVRLRWRAVGRPWREDFLRTQRGRPARASLPLSDEARALTAEVEISITAPRGYALKLGAGDAVVLGGRRPPLASLLRAALVVACGALAAAGLLRLIADLCSPPVAVLGVLTVMLFAAAAEDVYGSSSLAAKVAGYLPGGGRFDAASALRLGRAVGWSDVLSAALRAVSFLALASLTARRPSEATA